MKKKGEEEEEAERGWRREVKGALSGRGEESKRKRRRWRQRGEGRGREGGRKGGGQQKERQMLEPQMPVCK